MAELDRDCPTCHHPALQHLLMQVGESGIAVCKVCGESAAYSHSPVPICDFHAVRDIVARIYPAAEQHLTQKEPAP